MQKFLRLDFLPASPGLAFCLLRVWLGGSMLVLHGWGKLLNLLSGSPQFSDVFGIGPVPALVLAVLTEVGCSALLVIGLWTRLAALLLAGTMGVAFFVAHGAALKGAGSGELAYVYLAGYLVLLLGGAGKFSFDEK